MRRKVGRIVAAIFIILVGLLPVTTEKSLEITSVEIPRDYG